LPSGGALKEPAATSDPPSPLLPPRPLSLLPDTFLSLVLWLWRAKTRFSGPYGARTISLSVHSLLEIRAWLFCKKVPNLLAIHPAVPVGHTIKSWLGPGNPRSGHSSHPPPPSTPPQPHSTPPPHSTTPPPPHSTTPPPHYTPPLTPSTPREVNSVKHRRRPDPGQRGFDDRRPLLALVRPG
jgi:hypothetical protein